MAKGWYVLHVYSGYEKRVEMSVNELIQNKQLDGILFQIKVPTRDVSEIKNGKKKITKQKVFPGYVLLELDLDKRVWKEVYSTIKKYTGCNWFCWCK